MADRVVHLVAVHLPGASDITVTNLAALPGGNARKAWSFDLSWSERGRWQQIGCVMLCKTSPGQLDADIRQEFQILLALKDTGLPVPRVLWLDADGSCLGFPGFVMERGSGRANVRPLLSGERPSLTRELAGQLVSVAARLHTINWQKAGLGQLSEAAEGDQLTYWESQFEKVRLEPLPILSSIFSWLRRNQPRNFTAALVHGDLRLGNFLYQDGRLQLLLDWEMAHVGHPLEDLAWVYRPLWSPAQFLSLDEAAAIYESASGAEVDRKQLCYFQIFSEVKFATISLTAAHSFYLGKTDNLRMSGRLFKVNECLSRSLDLVEEWETA